MKPRTVAIIQARMSSTRLPGKVLKEAGSRTMLDRMVERVCRAKTLDEVVVATTVDPSDDAVAEFCQEHSIEYIRGSLQDVLDRYVQAALQYHAEIVVRLTGDCPLIDPPLYRKLICTAGIRSFPSCQSWSTCPPFS